MSDAQVDPVRQRRLVHGARFRSLPLSVRCKGGCAFCYEARVSQLLPQVTTEYIPPYDEERFDAFRQMHARALAWEAETGRQPLYASLPAFEMTPRGIGHFPICDIFSCGLTHAQIEELIRMRQGDVSYLYSVGLDLDPDFVGYLSRRYAETFRLHLSVVTFDPEVRRRLMNPGIDLEALRRVCTLTHKATFFLLLFTADQLVADVEQLLSLTTEENGGFFLHKLYHDRCSPRRVVEYARGAQDQREEAVRRVARLATGRRPLLCSLGGDIQAFTRRHEISSCLASSTGEADEVIFCSPGAFRVIDHYCARVENVVAPMESAFGGNVDLLQGCTARDVIGQLEALLASGRKLRRVLLPQAMFWIDGEYDLNGDRIEAIVHAFPELSLGPLVIPPPVIFSVVDLQDCLAFFDNPQRHLFVELCD